MAGISKLESQAYDMGFEKGKRKERLQQGANIFGGICVILSSAMAVFVVYSLSGYIAAICACIFLLPFIIQVYSSVRGQSMSEPEWFRSILAQIKDITDTCYDGNNLTLSAKKIRGAASIIAKAARKQPVVLTLTPDPIRESLQRLVELALVEQKKISDEVLAVAATQMELINNTKYYS